MSHVDPFNALGGFSVGIPPELVIDEEGNVVNNVNAPNANVTANRVYANYYYWANGEPLSIGASGSNTQVQFNLNGVLGASPQFTFNSASNLLSVANFQVNTRANLGNVANITITGGNNGYFLQTDGEGNLTWAPSSGGNGGNGSPAGANTQVQFNDAGIFGGDAGFVYNKTTNLLTVQGISTGNITANYVNLNWDLSANVVIANYLYGDGSNISNVNAATASVANSVAGANVTGQVNFAAVANSVAGANVTGQVSFANVANNVAAANIIGQVANALVAGTVYTAAQPNITSVGNLVTLNVIGNLSTGNANLGNSVNANYYYGNFYGTANLARTVINAAQPNITSVGTLTSLTVSGNTTLGNSVTANYFVGTLYGVANSANTANLANIANSATLANYALTAGTVVTNAQPNITSLGTLVSFNVNGPANLGNIANIKILGGTNGYVLSTDGAGNLSWTAQSGNGGNGVPGGSNTNIQFNDSGSFGGSNKFSWNNISDFLYVGGNANFVGNVSLNRLTATSANVQGNIIAGNVDGGNLVSANFISGTLTTNSQLNIHYLGNLGWLNVDTSIPNANGTITFNGDLKGIGGASNISITGNVDAGPYIQADLLVGAIGTSNQPNITSVGNLTSLTVVGETNLGDVSNLTILGGSPNYVLSTDGLGNLSWKVDAANGGTAPGGLNTYIQFNDGNTFGGDDSFTWNKNTNYLYVGGNANFTGFANASIFVSNVSTGSPPLIVTSTTPVANLGVQTADTVRNATQPNITSVGTLSNLTVSGTGIFTSNLSVSNTFSAGNITTACTIGTTNLNVTGTANFSNSAVVSGSGTLTINGKLNTAGASNVWFGDIGNLHISGGINGYVLATDGNANLYWTAGGSGGNGTPGGSNTQVQYNDNGTFNGSSFFTFNEATNNVQVAGNLIANTLTMGAGVYQFSRSYVYFATTNSTAEQTILAIEAANVAAIDYTIISDDGIIRNFIKISAVRSGSSVNYVEYSTLPINGYTGDFAVAYNAGNIITPASIQLKMTPQSSNLMNHKMMVTTYNM